MTVYSIVTRVVVFASTVLIVALSAMVCGIYVKFITKNAPVVYRHFRTKGYKHKWKELIGVILSTCFAVLMVVEVINLCISTGALLRGS